MIDYSVEWIKRGAYQSKTVFVGLTSTSFLNDVLTLSDLFAECGYFDRACGPNAALEGKNPLKVDVRRFCFNLLFHF